jgi:predicted HicB family RNase H-like nuclease
VEVDEEAGILHGRVVGLRDVITFQGETVREARREFERSVDSYLAFCGSRGEDPERPYSGKFLVRVDPKLHRALAHAAEAQNTSLNALVESALERVFGQASASVQPSGGANDPPRRRSRAGRVRP